MRGRSSTRVAVSGAGALALMLVMAATAWACTATVPTFASWLELNPPTGEGDANGTVITSVSGYCNGCSTPDHNWDPANNNVRIGSVQQFVTVPTRVMAGSKQTGGCGPTSKVVGSNVLTASYRYSDGSGPAYNPAKNPISEVIQSTGPFTIAPDAANSNSAGNVYIVCAGYDPKSIWTFFQI